MAANATRIRMISSSARACPLKSMFAPNVCFKASAGGCRASAASPGPAATRTSWARGIRGFTAAGLIYDTCRQTGVELVSHQRVGSWRMGHGVAAQLPSAAGRAPCMQLARACGMMHGPPQSAPPTHAGRRTRTDGPLLRYKRDLRATLCNSSSVRGAQPPASRCSACVPPSVPVTSCSGATAPPGSSSSRCSCSPALGTQRGQCTHSCTRHNGLACRDSATG